jgi:hypothetical protein
MTEKKSRKIVNRPEMALVDKLELLVLERLLKKGWNWIYF